MQNDDFFLISFLKKAEMIVHCWDTMTAHETAKKIANFIFLLDLVGKPSDIFNLNRKRWNVTHASVPINGESRQKLKKTVQN